MTHFDEVYEFSYDATGRPLTMTVDEECYYYVTNLQGDVVSILDNAGTTVTSYAYDAWGKIIALSGSLAYENPLRYRGYVYDEYTGLYYLQSRYYNPRTGRFINADAFASTGQGLLGNNMFAYCGNNPVNRADPTGQSWITIWDFLKLFHDWGFVHLCVELCIVAGNDRFGIVREVELPNGRRADIVDTKNGYVWEIKHGRHNIPAAQAQLKYYVGQKPDICKSALKEGPAGRFEGKLSIDIFGYIFSVKYETPVSGVIIYYVNIDRRNEAVEPAYIYSEMRAKNKLPQNIGLTPNPGYVTPGLVICAFGFSFGGAYEPVGTQLRDAFY